MVDDSESKEKDIPEDPLDFEIPDDLDGDLGDDWESAFQAEDFVFSEEIDEKGFLPNNGTDDIDLSALIDGDTTQQQEKSQKPEDDTEEPVDQAGDTTSSPSPSPHVESPASFFFSLLSWYKLRPKLQKILIPAVPALLIAIIIGSLFSNSTYKELEEQAHSLEKPVTVIPLKQDPPEKKLVAEPVPQSQQKEPVAPVVTEKKIRKKWPLPAFFIAAGEKNNPSTFVSIDLTLIALLKPEEHLPEDRLAYVRDTIFQFYRNRPADELRHFALARGEMIRQLNNWLKKEWPDSPITSVMFNKYQVTS